MDAQGVGLPDLSVVRVFAGDKLQTEATFKTVLLNASTTASDLVRQAIQRFRLPAGEDPADYFLTIKQVEGSSATLLPEEKPLGVFETLVEAAMELPKVKRSSVGSISSVASNLSMHPAIKKLSMNDFTDDSAVKFYLNRKGSGREGSITGDEGDDTILAESFAEDDLTSPHSSIQFLSPTTTSGSSATLERFSSPSYRFALQVVIHPEDLPDDMVFDPLTEAIVFKDTLRDRPTNSTSSSGISQTQRRKVFTFPKNATVAEVIEVGLERFGIIDGVVDGGDEVEDKMTKRRSSTRVRYGLSVDVGGREKELAPTSKVVEAFPRPPTFRAAKTSDSKRRSVDSAQLLLGSLDDIGPDDPVFLLRRAVTYRPSSRHRSSAPLDEIALQKLHRESLSSSSTMSDSTVGAGDEPKRQMSKQEIIAAQRAARSANQRAILSAQSNSARGLDVLLPGNAMIRSSRYDVDDRMRYSYVEPDGETYDISDIVEAEWREGGVGRERDPTRDDLLQGVITRDKDRLGAKLDRVLSKIKHDKSAGRATSDGVRATSPSVYSTAEGTPGSRSTTPNVLNGRSPTPTSGPRVMSPVSHISSYRTASPGESESRSRSSTATPSGSHQRGVRIPHERQQSLGSVVSDSSAYRSPTPSTPRPTKRRVVVPKDDFGVAQMMAVIAARGMTRDKVSLPPLDPVDNLLFGREIDINSLHPKIREIYSDTFKQLEEMDHSLDDLLHHVAHAF
ncbi:hypothetical protein NM688_g3294 [Phlebia brevispora]|uniref:Uncharacterized protein n=1 Tax=Phlebia brevispora TaxID=194682 RepID=A0ACC1T6C2_9APHY|nr:hypothetical protein NM688_g3294 [Phlebia brevispora]